MTIETKQTGPRTYRIWINGNYKGTFPKAVADIKIKRYTQMAIEELNKEIQNEEKYSKRWTFLAATINRYSKSIGEPAPFTW